MDSKPMREWPELPMTWTVMFAKQGDLEQAGSGIFYTKCSNGKWWDMSDYADPQKVSGHVAASLDLVLSQQIKETERMKHMSVEFVQSD